MAIVYRYVHHYRTEFYRLLRTRLEAEGVWLRVVAGRPGPGDAGRLDDAGLPWVEVVRNRYIALGGREVVWQSCLRRVWGADLVILEQASRLLVNYPLLAGRLAGGPKVAFWGQGRHVMPHRASPTSETVKRFVSRHVDWWFAYNERSADVVRSLGYPPERITAVGNAVDTRALRAERARVTEDELARLRAELGLAGRHVAVFCGSLYEEKRLPFLFATGDVVRSLLSDFELLVIGDGPEAADAKAAAVTRPWIHLLGPLRGSEKVRVMALADVLLIPGAVGLGIVDGFALELPLVTTAVPYQGYEAAYLRDGENGVVVDAWRDPDAYARVVAGLLTDDALLERLRDGCRAAAETYTVEAMAESFAGGVVQALRAPRR